MAIARGLLSFLCGAQGIATLAIDLNRTHATNPRWPSHARFHLVWQATSYAVLSLLEVTLILIPGPMQRERFYLAAALTSVPILGCLAAFFCSRLYDGSIFNPDGIRPVRVAIFGVEFRIDLNLAAEVTALLLLSGAVLLFNS